MPFQDLSTNSYTNNNRFYSRHSYLYCFSLPSFFIIFALLSRAFSFHILSLVPLQAFSAYGKTNNNNFFFSSVLCFSPFLSIIYSFLSHPFGRHTFSLTPFQALSNNGNTNKNRFSSPLFVCTCLFPYCLQVLLSSHLFLP